MEKLLVSQVNDSGIDLADFWFVERQPVGVLALKNLEVVAEEGLEGFEFFFGNHLPLAEVGGVDQVRDDSSCGGGNAFFL